MTLYSDEEKLKTFQEECRDYYYYRDRIKNLNDRLTVLINRMENTHSPVLDRISDNTSASTKDPIVPWLAAKASLEERIAAHEAMLKWIESCIDAIPYPAYRVLIWQTFITGDKLSVFANKYDVSTKHISQNRRKLLLMVLSDEKMQEHDQLQMNLINAESELLRKQMNQTQ